MVSTFGRYVTTSLNFPALFVLNFSIFQLFGRAQAAAISNGFNDDMDTYILIAGMAKTFLNFLAFILLFYIGIRCQSPKYENGF